MKNKKVEEFVKQFYFDELAITEPKEIDIEAIAFIKSASIKEEPLKGCEARIVGAGDRAIITVNSKSSIERKKFSIGHELGHWFKDRGKVGDLCSKKDLDENSKGIKPKEKIANQFASELLIPNYLLTKQINNTNLSIDLIRHVKESFETSFIVALRKMISSDCYMAFFANYYSNGNRYYYLAHSDMPYDFLPPKILPDGSLLKDLIRNQKASGHSYIDGEVWCKGDWANGAVVSEFAFHYFNNQYITLVIWENEEPIWNCITT